MLIFYFEKFNLRNYFLLIRKKWIYNETNLKTGQFRFKMSQYKRLIISYLNHKVVNDKTKSFVSNFFQQNMEEKL